MQQQAEAFDAFVSWTQTYWGHAVFWIAMFALCLYIACALTFGWWWNDALEIPDSVIPDEQQATAP